MKNSQLIDTILKQIKQPLWENWFIQERIGTGAYSAVYKVTAQRMSRTDVSALKIEPIVPDPSQKLDEAGKKRYIEEHRALAVNESTIMYSLRSCPNIVSYEDEDIRQLIVNGKLEGYYFLIRMEYLDCLSDLLKKRQYTLNEKNILRLACDIGRGIKAAHDLGIIHRDLKPGNFFIDSKGVYKLGDFNISKQTDISKDIAGTKGYLAPEVFNARSGAGYTRQADIYSFGICLYQLMNDLYMPFEDRMPMKAAVDKRMNGEALPPPKRASAGFSRIILRACAYSTNERYATIDDMLRELDALEKGAPTTPAPAVPAAPVTPAAPAAVSREPAMPSTSKPPQPAPFPQRNFDPMPVIIAILSLIVIGAAIFFCFKLLKKDDKDKTSSPEQSSMAAEVTEARNQSKISSIVLDSDVVDINVYEDITINSVDCPDKVSKDNITELFSYEYEVSELHASATVNYSVLPGNYEDIFVDYPAGLEVTSTNNGNAYETKIDASKVCGTEKDYIIIIRNADSSVTKTVTVRVRPVGPFHKDVKRFSSNPDVIRFNDDGTFTVLSTGTATISWVYNDEVKFKKDITIE